MSNLSGLNPFLAAASSLLIIQAGLFYSASKADSVPLPLPLSAFPANLGSFQTSREGAVEPETVAILRADDLLLRWYAGAQGGANLFIAYFQTQRTGQSPHSPKNCLPGEGFQPSESGTINIQTGGETINVNRYLVSKGEETSLVLYWYQTSARVIADEFAAKFYLVGDSITKHRSNTSLVRVVVPVQPGRIAEADKTAIAFVQELYPAVRSFLPR